MDGTAQRPGIAAVGPLARPRPAQLCCVKYTIHAVTRLLYLVPCTNLAKKAL